MKVHVITITLNFVTQGTETANYILHENVYIYVQFDRVVGSELMTRLI